MTASASDLLATAILVLGIGKAGWDFFLSGQLHKRDEQEIERGETSANDKLKHKIKALGQRRARDSRANQIAFAATTALSAWLIAIGLSSADVDPDDVSDLQSQVTALERQVSAIELRLPPE